MTFKEYINEKNTVANVEEFLISNDITNMDLKLDGKIIKMTGYIEKTGRYFDDFYDMMKNKSNKEFLLYQVSTIV